MGALFMRVLKVLAGAVMMSLILGGCWDRREPEEVIAALAIGFDLDDQGLYEVTIQYSNPSVVAGSNSGGQGGNGDGGRGGKARTFWTNSAKGRTPFEAIRNLAPEVTRLTTLAHLEIVLISERLARHGIGPIIDLYERNVQLRLSVIPAVVEGSLKRCLDLEFPLENTPATGLARLFRLIASERSVVASGLLLEKLIILARPGQEVVISRLQVFGESDDKGGASGESRDQGSGKESKDDNSGKDGTGEEGAISPEPPAMVCGAAAFRGEKMVGWLDLDEIRGWNWIMGEAKRGPVLIEIPGRNVIIALDVICSESTITPVIEGDDIGVKVEIETCARIEDEVDLGGRVAKMDYGDPDTIEMLRQEFAGDIRRKVHASLARAKELGVDIFGFGNLIYRKRPKVWQSYAGERWDDIFKDIKVDIDIKTNISRPGLVMSSGARPVAHRQAGRE
jgi:spore germination protein KC